MNNVFKIERKKKVSIVNQSVSQVEMTMYGPIGGFYEDAIRLSDVASALKEIPETVNTINLRINSPGGDVFEGIAIYNRLKQHKAKVVVYVDAIAASIASIIAMAGDEIIMGEGAEIMIHRAMTFSFGNSNDFENIIQRLDEVDQNLIGILARRSGMDRIEVARMMDAETFMDTDEAIKKGFADRVIENEEKVQYVACSDFSEFKWLKRSPATNLQNNEVKNKLEDVIKDIDGFIAR
jgi:ATP-dependent Clp endopeptidase proteolytic subunit ClpP